MSEQVEILEKEKNNLIRKYVSLKEKYQNIYFRHEEIKKENERLKLEISNLNEEKKKSSDSKNKSFDDKNKPNEDMDKSILRENRSLVAKIDQLKRQSISTPTKPNKCVPTKPINAEYEVLTLLKHRGRKGKREFLVRWKEYPASQNSWEKEENLSCPQILKKYLEKKRLA